MADPKIVDGGIYFETEPKPTPPKLPISRLMDDLELKEEKPKRGRPRKNQ